MPAIKTEHFAKVAISSPQELRDWLSQHHDQDESVWVVTFKKHVPDKYVSTQEVLDQLLCFGWIDGIRRKLDEERTMQLIGPRRAQPGRKLTRIELLTSRNRDLWNRPEGKPLPVPKKKVYGTSLTM